MLLAALDKQRLDASKGFELSEMHSTEEIIIPKDPLDRVIGQDEAIEMAKLAARQKRHLLLVGPPGTGKSMIGQALSLHLHHPTEEIQVVHNPEKPERPFVEIKSGEIVKKEREKHESAEGELIDPKDAPINVVEKLGYKCMSCGHYSDATETLCEKCGKPKIEVPSGSANQPFGDIQIPGLKEVMGLTLGMMNAKENTRVTTTRKILGKEEVVVYERAGPNIKVLNQKALEKRRELEKLSPRNVIVPLRRKNFVLATGASETELLGDVKHDPYGGHPQLGTPPYERVVPGSVHEAHEGVLFVDELPHLGHLQHYILTAMQDKRFPIVGRNPQSAGASVRVDNVPCDFIFVGACNIQDISSILSPLRSRIIGAGYEVLMGISMEDTPLNQSKLAQFVAQEIIMDGGKIPHASSEAVEAIINESRKRASESDSQGKALTLRLRELGGLVRMAGDLAVLEKTQYIEKRHIVSANKKSRTIEEQIKERYGSYNQGMATDLTASQRNKDPYMYWNKHVHDDRTGYS